MSNFLILTLFVISTLLTTFTLIFVLIRSRKNSEGQTRMNLRNSLSNARMAVEDARLQLLNVKNQFDTIKRVLPNESTSIYERNLKRYEDLVNSRIENFLNIYDSACLLYQQNKINAKEFKREYMEEIGGLFDSKFFERFFGRKSSYKALIEVYSEWYNKPIVEIIDKPENSIKSMYAQATPDEIAPELIQNIKQSILNNNLDEALNRLEVLLKGRDETDYILLKVEYNTLKNNKLNGVITDDSYNIGIQRTVVKILEVIASSR